MERRNKHALKINNIRRVLAVLLTFSLLLTGCGGAGTSASLPPISSIQSLNTKQGKLGVTDDGVFDLKAAEVIPNAQLLHFKDGADGLLAVLTSKFDGFIFDRCNLEYMIAAHDELMILPESLGELNICAAAAKGNTALVAELNAFIDSYMADGTKDDMYNRWITINDHKTPEIPLPTGQTKTLRIAINSLTEPFNFYSNNEVIGYDIEFAKRFAAAYNYELEFSSMNYDAIAMAISSGKVDCIISHFFYNEERANEVEYSKPYLTTDIAILSLASRYSGEGSKGGKG